MLGSAEQKQQGKDYDIQLTFPNLRRPQGDRTVGFVGQSTFGIQKAEAAAGRCAEGVTVEQVGHASDGLADKQRRRNDICQSYPVDVMQLAVNNAGSNACQHTALYGHTALPDEGDFQQMLAVVIPVEEENVPQPAADKTGKAAVDANV